MNFKAALPLIALMAITRVHHFGDAFSLPDASLATFFLAGLFFSQRSLFLALLIEAVVLDYVAIVHFYVSDFCVSPAYVFLIPTYFAMWFGGRLCAKFKSMQGSELTLSIPAMLTLLVATSTAFLISNVSFYVLSENVTQHDFSHYAAQMVQYYLLYTGYAFLYSIIGFASVRAIKLLPFSSVSKNA